MCSSDPQTLSCPVQCGGLGSHESAGLECGVALEVYPKNCYGSDPRKLLWEWSHKTVLGVIPENYFWSYLYEVFGFSRHFLKLKNCSTSKSSRNDTKSRIYVIYCWVLSNSYQSLHNIKFYLEKLDQFKIIQNKTKL